MSARKPVPVSDDVVKSGFAATAATDRDADCSFASGLEGPPSYAVTKAALNALTVKLAQEVPEGVDVKINAACPGWVRTDMGSDRAPLSVEEGADTPVWLATLPEGGPSGGLYRERRVIPW